MAVLYVKPEVRPSLELDGIMNDISKDIDKRADNEEGIKSIADELLEKSGLADKYTSFDRVEKLEQQLVPLSTDNEIYGSVTAFEDIPAAGYSSDNSGLDHRSDEVSKQLENKTSGSSIQTGTDSDWVATYRDIFNGIPIEESYIKIFFTEGKYNKIERKWYSPISLHSRKGEIISPIKAVMQLLGDKKEDELVIIKDIELVYWVNASLINTVSPVDDTAIPAWKLTDNKGDIRYISGY
jgi:hypothetical protein